MQWELEEGGDTEREDGMLACLGLTYVAPDGADRLLETSRNIAEVGQLLFPILVSQAPSFK